MKLSQVCLNGIQRGRNLVTATVGDECYSFACLEFGKVEHMALDLQFDSSTVPSFKIKGDSEVHLIGYIERCEPVEDDEEEEESEEELFTEDEEITPEELKNEPTIPD